MTESEIKTCLDRLGPAAVDALTEKAYIWKSKKKTILAMLGEAVIRSRKEVIIDGKAYQPIAAYNEDVNYNYWWSPGSGVCFLFLKKDRSKATAAEKKNLTMLIDSIESGDIENLKKKNFGFYNAPWMKLTELSNKLLRMVTWETCTFQSILRTIEEETFLEKDMYRASYDSEKPFHVPFELDPYEKRELLSRLESMQKSLMEFLEEKYKVELYEEKLKDHILMKLPKVNDSVIVTANGMTTRCRVLSRLVNVEETGVRFSLTVIDKEAKGSTKKEKDFLKELSECENDEDAIHDFVESCHLPSFVKEFDYNNHFDDEKTAQRLSSMRLQDISPYRG